MRIATVCSGIGSPEMALIKSKISHEISFACEIDKYAAQTYLANYTPEMMLKDMTKESWKGSKFHSDLFIGGIPCQSFSLAGKRLGENDSRGLLFYDFYRYVKVQQPKYFIIENVKGLLSDNKGRTFQNWIDLLGQSLNKLEMVFPHEDSLMYNLHCEVLNTKDYGLPHNRERVFLIGIRNDLSNDFNFPKTIPLKLRLKDILEDQVDEKYYLSEKMIDYLTMRKDNFNNGKINFKYPEDIASCLNASAGLDISDNILKIKSATKSGYEIATKGDSINLSQINSKTRRGRVGKQVAQTLDTACNQGVVVNQLKQIGQLEGFESEGRIYDSNGISRTIKNGGGGSSKTGWYQVQEGEIFRIRKLTPLECFRLQGYPDSFVKPVSNSQLYKQAGNTISVNVIEALINNLLKI